MTLHSRRVLFLGAALGVLASLMLMLYVGAMASLRESRQANYRALLDAQVARLQQWIDERRADVEQLASDPYILQLARRLAAAGENACVGQDIHLANLRDVVAFRFGRRAPSYVHLLDSDGRVLLSTIARRCGTQLPEEVRARLMQARQRGSAFVRPLESTEGGGMPLVWYEAPVRDAAGNPVAYVGYGVAAQEAFGFLADQGHFGASGEIYVIDLQGSPISALRWPVSPRADAASPWLDRIAAVRKDAALPDALAGAVLEPYPGYAGRKVVGVWRWLPRRGIGLVLEADAAETFGPVRHLRWIAWQSGVLAVLALAVGLFLRRSEERTGRRIGAYRILGPLGEGAVSNVYLAEHILMRRRVALKVLKLRASSDEWLARFRREARLAGRLNHPNFARLFDYGHSKGDGFYYAMEYLAGCNLAELVEREGIQPAERVVHLLKQACAALEEAHGLGILHRDIKPQNLMVCTVAGQPDVLKVLDFGLVKQTDGSDDSRDLTVGLRILGTPAYLAPERIIDPASTDPRADLYALGAVGFYLLTGRKPFESESDLQLTHRILHEAVPRASTFNPGVPPALDELLARCMAKDPAQRPASARALHEQLDALVA